MATYAQMVAFIFTIAHIRAAMDDIMWHYTSCGPLLGQKAPWWMQHLMQRAFELGPKDPTMISLVQEANASFRSSCCRPMSAIQTDMRDRLTELLMARMVQVS
jgi:hypothetical protein